MFTNMNQAQKDLVERTLSFAGVIIAVLLLLGFSDIRKHITNAEEFNSKRTEVAIGNQYRKHASKIKNQVDNSNDNSNPVVKSIINNRIDYFDVRKPMIDFNTVFFQWDSQSQYDNRSQKVSDYVTDNVIKNKNIFNNKLGKNINSQNLNSVLNNGTIAIESDSGNNITALVEAYFTTWQSNDSNDDDSDDDSGDSDDNRKAGSEWMEVTYNKASKKVTSIKPLSLDPTYHNHEAGTNLNPSITGSGVEY